VVCNDLAEKLNAEFVQAIGRKFVLYRRARAKDKRKIVL
jgi:CRS1 / yhbY (CRM) domain